MIGRYDMRIKNDAGETLVDLKRPLKWLYLFNVKALGSTLIGPSFPLQNKGNEKKEILCYFALV